MTPKQLKQFNEDVKKHVSEAVKLTVNGRIDAVGKKLDEYIKADEAWKVRAEPVVKAFENSNWLLNLLIKVLKFVASIGAAVGAVIAVTKLIK